jgi:hypothetical protein
MTTPRIVEELRKGQGPDGKDLIVFIDTISKEVIKEYVVESTEALTIKKSKPRPTMSWPLMSANEMTDLAIKQKRETIGVEAEKISKTILEECAKDALSGSYTHLIDEEVPSSVAQEIINIFKKLGYKITKKTVAKKGTSITVSWKTTKVTQKKSETQKSLETKKVRRKRAPKDAEDAPSNVVFTFQEKRPTR